jgi:hypothetical protein
MLLAGTAIADISPEPGDELGGTRPSRATYGGHDPLYAPVSTSTTARRRLRSLRSICCFSQSGMSSAFANWRKPPAAFRAVPS